MTLTASSVPKPTTTVQTFPIFRSLPRELSNERYRVGIAHTREEIEAAQRLRFLVFNIEQRRGLARSFTCGKDVDEFDSGCTHVIMIDRKLSKVVGTCRLQVATCWTQLYAATKFDIGALPNEVLTNGIEFGRFAIAEAHRKKSGIQLFRRFLDQYFKQQHVRYVFGCCSLGSQDPLQGGQVYEMLQNWNYLHPKFHVKPKPGLKCFFYKTVSRDPLRLPNLFRTYLKSGALVCGHPALDREFRTIDFFTIRDLRDCES